MHPGQPELPSFWKRFLSDWKGALPYGLFGIAAGMALASKISAAPLVLLLPLGAWVWWDRLSPEDRSRAWPTVLRNLAIGGFFCLLAFRSLDAGALNQFLKATDLNDSRMSVDL